MGTSSVTAGPVNKMLEIERHVASASSLNHVHDSQVMYKCRDIAGRWKERFCVISPSTGSTAETSPKLDSFTLPDGTHLTVHPSTWGAAW